LNRKIHKIKVLFVIICILQLFYIFHFRSGFQYEVIKNPFSENAGLLYAVSPEVIESKNILKKHKAIDFNLSAGLKEDTYFYQRFIEFNYPIRINLNSNLIFFLKKEEIADSCRIIENGKYLKLIRC
tara:strand:+ start:126 stop:506 length:381 start_codon:yes stop_codon:yes gene_type:complete